ncbi:hypothetical protein ACMAZF_05895 [Psychrobium sp. nBUS_13]|uniref:hypothetical protein n=1 Tax=Psychrobium sp. nBUS_13 TaxID=3395319 RepID=UPI003EB8F752
MALVDKNGRCRHQQKLSLGDCSDPHQVATFHRAIARLIKPYSIASVKLTPPIALLVMPTPLI